MRQVGTITEWNDEKGYGFLTPRGGGRRVFIHISAFSEREYRPKLDETVAYDVAKDPKGRTRAIDAVILSKKTKRIRLSTGGILLIGFALGYIGLICELSATGILWYWLPIYSIGICVFTYLMYGLDKWRAENGTWRTPEVLLHWFSLAGGWPGAILAQQLIRHKVRKPSFMGVFWLTVVLNVVIITFIGTPFGESALKWAWDLSERR